LEKATAIEHLGGEQQKWKLLNENEFKEWLQRDAFGGGWSEFGCGRPVGELPNVEQISSEVNASQDDNEKGRASRSNCDALIRPKGEHEARAQDRRNDE